MNARYQKFTEPKGQTRKSAAAAKPSRKGGASSASSSSSKKPATRSAAHIDPQTPEFKRLRQMWWISLGSGMALVAVSFGVRTYLKSQPWANPVGAISLMLAYAAIFYALYLDWAKMRPMRKSELSGGAKSAKAEKPSKAAKDENSGPDAE
jgi:hypothetical protein